MNGRRFRIRWADCAALGGFCLVTVLAVVTFWYGY